MSTPYKYHCERFDCSEVATHLAYVAMGGSHTYVRVCEAHAIEYPTHYRIAGEI